MSQGAYNAEERIRKAFADIAKQIQDTTKEKPQLDISEPRELNSDKVLIKNIDDKDKSEWINLRTKYANKIYYLLAAEIAFVCVIITIDGFNLLGFKTNEWLLGSVFYGALVHTFLLVRTIVKNLFTR